MTIAPIKATNNTKEAISKGMAHRVNRELARSAKAGLWASVFFTEFMKKEGMSTPSIPKAATAARGHCRLSEFGDTRCHGSA